MLLFISLLVFISESSGFYTSWSPATVSLITTPSVDLRPLQVEAVPDYPVTAGQTVTLFCSSVNSYIWQHLVNLNWQDVGQDGNLTLTQPQQSGLYRCRARTTSLHISRNLTVNIEPTVNTVKKDLAEPAFVLSLLGFVISLGIVGWLLWGKFSNYISTSTKTEAKGTDNASKGTLPKTESDGDVYMNYTNSQAYTTLDPNSMTADNVYASLS